jgi:AraC family transcriptional regulator, regulatory protein of adaptative response / methylated-DNA-[protein]-cysteine methyltransferase
METMTLPSRDEMLAAVMSRDAGYDGVFVTAVRTTGIFCRPSCSARKPLPSHVAFYPTAREALIAGYRPCLRCRPLEAAGETPEWLRPLLVEVEDDPTRRWRDQDLRLLKLNPDRVRRWFLAHHDMTFQAYTRARRLGLALGRIQGGERVTTSALDHGYDSLSGFQEAFQRLFGAAPTRTNGLRPVAVRRLATPLGAMLAAGGDDGLHLLEFADRRMLETQITRVRRRMSVAFVPGNHQTIDRAEQELAEYFAGARRSFTIPLADRGTEFQEEVWRRLREIPYGATVSYGAIAREMGRPTSMRAVARANGDNRFAIVIPCHRVIGADGQLTGYGGGLWRKQRLLEHEQRNAGAGARVALGVS